MAAPEDLTRQAENQLLERDNYAYCQACVSNLSLSLKLVAVEITLDNFKTIFYYTSQERVDFRQLVRELVNRLRTRIEMRQIGTRQEALKLGGLGICGRPFCCSSFLSNFCQVSVRMAKEQNLSLNAAKISGVCGRLMCCLSFERYPKNVKSQNLPQDKAQEAALGADDPDIEERENYELTEGAVDYLEDHWARIEPSSEEPADLAVTEANLVASRKELQEDAREEPPDLAVTEANSVASRGDPQEDSREDAREEPAEE
ncbi:MAG: hypothetical protein LBT38_06435 [Deltaproteobacteria bacterium]|nr:hypothetical protein [Deltaproteobacteria bacterium]